MKYSFGPDSPEYQNIIGSVESLGLRYNPVLADKIITKYTTFHWSLKAGWKVDIQRQSNSHKGLD